MTFQKRRGNSVKLRYILGNVRADSHRRNTALMHEQAELTATDFDILLTVQHLNIFILILTNLMH